MRKLILFVILFLGVAGLQAGLPFWLESPTRSNPHDPKNSNKVSLPIAPIPSPTPDLLVKFYDNNGVAVSGVWVQVGNNSAGAKQTDALGRAAFNGLSFPAIVHAFPHISGFMDVISVTGVTGPVLELWSIGGGGSTAVTVTVSVTHSGASSVGYYLNCFSSGGYPTGAQGSGLSGNPATGVFGGQVQGQTANFMAYNTDTFATAFTEAAFAPPALLSGPNTNINLVLGPSGWSSATFTVTVLDTLSGGPYYFYGVGGSSPSNFYNMPVISSYSSTSPTAVFGPMLLPSPISFYGLELSSNSVVSSITYARSVHLTSTAMPVGALVYDMPLPLQWTRSPTAIDPHLTVLNPDSRPVDLMLAYVDQEWAVVSLQPAPGTGLDIQYPTLPTAVTWLAPPFAGAGPHNVVAFTEACISPIGQVFGAPSPFGLRNNSLQFSY